ncbi:50S ribosomal protein L44e [archaeon]|nr:50S ribosomal protein L44e [archaeon]
MKVPKIKKAYCKKCKEHTEHKVTENKTTGKRGTLKKGSIARSKARGLGRGFGNLGKWGSKPAMSKFKRTGSKSSKKIALKLTCQDCKKSSIQSIGRLKKVEFE